MLYSLLVWFLQCLGFDPRGIFVFWDGRKWRRSDPIIVSRALEEIPNFHPTETPSQLATDDPVLKVRIAGEIASAVRIAFHVRSLDDGGLTELECINLYTQFTDYMTGQKKSTELIPTSLPPTESPPLGESITKNESVSGLTASGNTNEPHGLSAGESAAS